jgi:hypothetical protein
LIEASDFQARLMLLERSQVDVKRSVSITKLALSNEVETPADAEEKELVLQDYLQAARDLTSSASSYLGSVRGTVMNSDGGSVLGLDATRRSAIDRWIGNVFPA